jgi:signal transduction histidine kinase
MSHDCAVSPVVGEDRSVLTHVLTASVDASGVPVSYAAVREQGRILAVCRRPTPARTGVEHPVDGDRLWLHLEGDTGSHQLRDLAGRLAPHVRTACDLDTPRRARSTPGVDPMQLADFEHRLRTRLTVARGWLDLLRNQQGAGRSEEALEITSRQLVEIEEMLRTRGPSRSGGQTPPALGRIDLATAVRRSMRESAWSLAPCVQGPFTRGVARPLHVDAGQLHDALMHLLDNATEHTPPDTRIEVRLSYEAAAVRLSVEDAGPGFPAGLEARLGVGSRVVDRLAASMGASVSRGDSRHLGGAAVHLLWRD